MDGLIRKIIIGRDPKDAMAYYVGMKAGREVSTSSWTTSNLSWYNVKRYRILAQRRLQVL